MGDPKALDNWMSDIVLATRYLFSFDTSWNITSLLWHFSRFMHKHFLVWTHHIHNTSHGILLYSYIRYCAECHRFGSCLCYTLAFHWSCKDNCHRKMQPVSVAAFVSVCRSFRTDANKNSNLSSFPLDSLQRCREVETFFAVFVSTSHQSQPSKEGGKLLLKPFSCCVFLKFCFSPVLPI